MSSGALHKYFPPVAALLGIFLGIRYLFPLLTPFLMAILVAFASEPLVRVLQKRLHFGRGLASGIGVTITLIVTVLLLLTLLAFLLRELTQLAGVLPDLESTATDGIASLENFCLSLADRSPDNIRPVLTGGVEQIFSGSSQILDQVSVKALSLASGVIKAVPDSALGLGTWVLASFMTSARLPRIKAFFRTQLPAKWRKSYLPALKRLRHALAGWLTAQLKLTGVTLCILTAGFLLLRISYAPLWAALISLVDALPILGTGTILVPWSLICFLQGDHIQAVGLLGIYAVAAVLRSVLEPKLVGKQLGLDPLVTLLALYVGYRLWGILGMLLSPLLAVTVTQIFVKPDAEL